jgi:ATP-dependent DNA ligase
LPLEDRRAELERIVTGADTIMFNESIAAEGELVFRKACELGCDGIVSKRVGSIYWTGRCRNRTKTKTRLSRGDPGDWIIGPGKERPGEYRRKRVTVGPFLDCWDLAIERGLARPRPFFSNIEAKLSS